MTCALLYLDISLYALIDFKVTHNFLYSEILERLSLILLKWFKDLR